MSRQLRDSRCSANKLELESNNCESEKRRGVNVEGGGLDYDTSYP